MKLFIIICLLVSSCFSLEPLRKDLPNLYRTIASNSIAENLAFYELYPESCEGKKALTRAWYLLTKQKETPLYFPFLPFYNLHEIITSITKSSSDPDIELNEESLHLIKTIGSRLLNRKLKGSHVFNPQEVLLLPPEEIDLGRALLIYQYDKDSNKEKKIFQYEAYLDLMVLQVEAQLSSTSSFEEKINQINHFIFQEMGFRFPPHSLYAKEIDLYTFLPSVLDNREGVCLGVTILYLCIAQRVGLPLEIITPPGHIFLRYTSSEDELNIETTARGIHLPSETYFGINTAYLPKHTIKEVIGFSFVNKASVFWNHQNYKEAVNLYEIALQYLPSEPLVKGLLGLNYLFIHEEKKGRKLLETIQSIPFEGVIKPETFFEDYLKGRVDTEGLKTIFLPVDEKRSSILEKLDQLKQILKKYPKFREGYFQLATAYLQLGKVSKAIDVLLQYEKIDSHNPTVKYYLSLLYKEEAFYRKAWAYCLETENILSSYNPPRKLIDELKLELRRFCPEPKKL